MLVALLGAMLMTAVASLTPHGSPESAVHQGVSARYLERGAEEAGSHNIVTAILLNYRGMDTAGEVTVIFAAFIAAAAVLLSASAPQPHRQSAEPAEEAHPVSPVVHFMVRLMVPFIILFSVNVMLNGHITPGGGFQGGAILGALFIVLSVVLGPARTDSVLRSAAGPWLRSAAVLSFVLVGLVGAFLTGVFLGFPITADAHLAGELMMIALDFGIGIGGAAIFGSIYLMLGATDA